MPAPLRFGEDIYYCSLPTLSNRRRGDWTWQDRLQLNTSTSNNRFRFISRSCKPADVITAIDPVLQSCLRFRAQNLNGVAGNVSHILKHPCAMPGDHGRIPHGSTTNFKGGCEP